MPSAGTLLGAPDDPARSMPFLAPILLFGAAAFTIPLIIHLLNRRRFRTVPWAATHLLSPVIRKNNRRLTLEQLLLLLVRIAIPVLLALCLARPVLTDTKIFGREAKSSKVFLVDNSYSMQAPNGDGSRLDQVRRFVSEVIGEMRDGSDASIVFAGDDPFVLTDDPTSDLVGLMDDFRPETRFASVADPAAALLAAVGEMESMTNVAREVVVLSDFQARDWSAKSAAARREALEMLEALPVKPAVTLVPFRATQGVENLSIESVETSRLVVGVGQPLVLRVNVRNHGRSARPVTDVRLEIDGELVGAMRIRLEPEQAAQVLFNAKFDSAGDHAIRVELGHDGVPADNTWFASVPVWDEVPVLLVDGDPSFRPLASETDFLRLALRPFSSASTGLRDLIVTETMESNRLNARATENVRVLILANVRDLREDQVKAVERFVADGGSLIVFPGDRTDFNFHDQRLHRGGEGLLPARWESLAGEIAGGGPTRIRGGRFEHPAMYLFNDERNGDVSKAAVRSWARLADLADDAGSIAALQSGDPLGVESRFGEGRVLQMAIPADADWGNLPTRPEFVPMMQRLVVHLATNSRMPRSIEVGKPVSLALSREAGAGLVEVRYPSGRTAELEAREEAGQFRFDFTDTAEPGHYGFKLPGGERRWIAVNHAREESDMALLTDEQLARLADESDASMVADLAAYRELDKNRRVGVEFWKPFLAALLGLMILEVMLQRWLSRRKLKPEKRRSAPEPQPAMAR
ncbi:MAG: BatA domain-containing protein [Verrucomicrobiota bacterium]